MYIGSRKCPTFTAMQPSNWLCHPFFGEHGWAGTRFCHSFISLRIRTTNFLVIMLVIQWSMWSHLLSRFVCSFPRCLRCLGLHVFHGHNLVNLNILKSVLKHMKTDIRVLILKAVMVLRKTSFLSIDLTYQKHSIMT